MRKENFTMKSKSKIKWTEKGKTSFEETETLIDDLEGVCDILDVKSKLVEMGFLEAPASTCHHLAIAGGLMKHSLNVANALIDLTKKMNLNWSRSESPIIIGLFHDLCKCDCYKKAYIAGYEWNDETLFKGHGTKSVMLASTLLQLTEEEVACITYHMGAFTDKNEWTDYSRAIRKYPNVLYTHTADMIATHIMEKGEQ